MPARFNPNKFADAAQATIDASAKRQDALALKVAKAEERVEKATKARDKAQAALDAEKASVAEAEEYLASRTARANAAAAPQGEVIDSQV